MPLQLSRSECSGAGDPERLGEGAVRRARPQPGELTLPESAFQQRRVAERGHELGVRSESEGLSVEDLLPLF